MLASYRDIVAGTNTTKAGKWEKKTMKGREVYGKTLGIAGMGRIGQAVAERALVFGMKVLAYDPYVKSDRYENVTMDQLVARSDFITLHLPLTPETKHMIGKAQFAKMKDGVVILNVARGGTIDENALYEAMKSGKVRAACLDVFEVEPPAGNKLLELPNLLCTPHIGAQTDEGQHRAGVMVAEAVIAELKKLG
jgi:D-3-phosphoglycerate dehydrogenase